MNVFLFVTSKCICVAPQVLRLVWHLARSGLRFSLCTGVQATAVILNSLSLTLLIKLWQEGSALDYWQHQCFYSAGLGGTLGTQIFRYGFVSCSNNGDNFFTKVYRSVSFVPTKVTSFWQRFIDHIFLCSDQGDSSYTEVYWSHFLLFQTEGQLFHKGVLSTFFFCSDKGDSFSTEAYRAHFPLFHKGDSFFTDMYWSHFRWCERYF